MEQFINCPQCQQPFERFNQAYLLVCGHNLCNRCVHEKQSDGQIQCQKCEGITNNLSSILLNIDLLGLITYYRQQQENIQTDQREESKYVKTAFQKNQKAQPQNYNQKKQNENQSQKTNDQSKQKNKQNAQNQQKDMPKQNQQAITKQKKQQEEYFLLSVSKVPLNYKPEVIYDTLDKMTRIISFDADKLSEKNKYNAEITFVKRPEFLNYALKSLKPTVDTNQKKVHISWKNIDFDYFFKDKNTQGSD